MPTRWLIVAVLLSGFSSGRSAGNEPPATPVADPLQEPSPSPQSAQARDSSLPPTDARCLVVPLEGDFGESITAPGIRNALLLAKREGIKHVLLVFDTPGGRLVDGKAVAEQIRRNAQGLTVHAIIDEAFSAAVWSLVECQVIWVRPGGRTGAAVAYTRGKSSKDPVEVDAKQNAALGAELAARADAQGLPGALFRAMVDMRAEVWMSTGPDGAKHFHATKPAGPESTVLIDRADTVVALTARDLVEFGLAHNPPDAEPTAPAKWHDLRAFGQLVDGTRAVKDGADQVERALKALREAEARFEDANLEILARAKTLRAQVQQAYNSEPSRQSYIYDSDSGLMTPASQQKWRDWCDVAIQKWSGVEAGLDSLGETVESAKAAISSLTVADRRLCEAALWVDEDPTVTQLAPVDHGIDADELRSIAEAKIRWLRNHRARYY